MALVIVLSLVSLALQQVGSAQQADQAPPPFRAGVELVRIPVRVLDNKGRFVPGLTRDDFRVFEDGAPQAIATFDLIEFRPADSGSPAPKGTEKTAAPGDLSPGVRTYVVLIDDYHLLPDDVAKTKSVAKTFLREHTTIDDRVAVVFTSGATGQDLTSDGSLLLSAVERLRGQFGASETVGIVEMKARGVVTAIHDIARDLSSQGTAVRRTILLFSPGIGCTPSAAPGRMPWCGSGLTDALRAAAGSSVTVYAVDPRGSRNPAWRGASAESTAISAGALSRTRNGIGAPDSNFVDAMHTLADDTGGFSLTNSENFKNAFERIALEMSQYYVVGYYPARSGVSDSVHQNEIRVSRSGTKAFYRRTYVGAR